MNDAIRALIEENVGVRRAGREGGNELGSRGVEVRIAVLPLLSHPHASRDETAEHTVGEREATEEAAEAWAGIESEIEAKIRAYCHSLVEHSIKKGGMDTITDMEIEIDVLLINDLAGSVISSTLPSPSHPTSGNRYGNTVPRAARIESSRASLTTGPGWVLAAKIAGAAAEMGYPFEAVRNVARLVMRNVGSANIDTGPRSTKQDQGVVPEGKDEEVEVELQVRAALARLLEDGGAKTMVVNSNEPVLLLNTWGDCLYTVLEMEALMSQTMGQLHADHGIRPVRVYAGEFLSQPAESGGEKGFSISILNVVNTELGGPSMIQLLDAPSGAAAWDAKVGKEEWEGSDGSVSRTVQLGMRNWSERVDPLSSRQSQDPGITEKEPGYGIGNNQYSAADPQPEIDCSSSRNEQQDAKVDELAESRDRNLSVVEEDKDENEKHPEVDGAEGKEKDQDVLSGNDSSTVDETRRGINTIDGEILAQEKAIGPGKQDIFDREVTEEKEKSESGKARDQVELSKSAKDDFEIVDRARTLIDMVLGPRKRE